MEHASSWTTETDCELLRKTSRYSENDRLEQCGRSAGGKVFVDRVGVKRENAA
jgi:hypothetical protein